MAKPPSINEQLADQAVSHAIGLQRFATHEVREIRAFLHRLEERLEDVIRSLRAKDLASPGPMRATKVENLLGRVRELLAREFTEIADAVETLNAGLAAAESAIAMKTFRTIAIKAELGANFLTANQLRSIASRVLIEGAPSRSWWSRQAGELMESFSEQIREGLALGETTDDLVRRIRGRATGNRNVYEVNGRQYTFVEFRGGIMDTSTRNAEALVRTSVQAVAADARRSTYEENQDVVKGVVQISTLDDRTTATCLARGGKAWLLPNFEPLDHDIAYAGGVPLHWNCRSTEAPLLRSWKELGIDLQDAPGGVRWSRLDGDVPADFTMEQFLDRRSDKTVDDMLGPGVAELWRAKSLDLGDLIDKQTSRPLSLDELERRYGSVA